MHLRRCRPADSIDADGMVTAWTFLCPERSTLSGTPSGAGTLSVLLDSITDPNLLEDVGEWLLVCDRGEALLARLSRV